MQAPDTNVLTATPSRGAHDIAKVIV